MRFMNSVKTVLTVLKFTGRMSGKLSAMVRMSLFFRKTVAAVTRYYQGSVQLRKNSQQCLSLLKRQSSDPTHRLTRSETLLIRTTKADLQKAIPFFTLLLLLPEALPFLVLRGSNIIPSTCLSQDQRETQRKKRMEVRMAIRKELETEMLQSNGFQPDDLSTPETLIKLAAIQPQYFAIHSMNRRQLKMFSKYYGFAQWKPDLFLKASLNKHFAFIKQDDAMLLSDGQDVLSSLNDEELREATEIRGFCCVSEPTAMKDVIKEWIKLHLSEDPVMQPGLLMLYSIFKSRPFQKDVLKQ